MLAEPSINIRKYFSSPALAAIAIALVTLVLYLPAINGDFLNWDDDLYVLNNPNMSGLSLEFVKYAFTSAVNSNYHPITMLSYAMDHTIWGMSSRGFHLTNVLLHALNTALVVLLAFNLIKLARGDTKHFNDKMALMAAGITGILFGAHPLHVESVAWVSERKDVLYTAFFLSGMLTYIRYPSKGKVFYWLTLFFFALSISSKPMAVTFPFILLILDYYPLRRLSGGPDGASPSGVIMEKLPLIAIAVVFTYITINIQGDALASFRELPWHERPLVAARGLGFYLYKFILPTGLAPFYRANTSPAGLTDILNLMALTGITVYCMLTFRKKRLWTALWAFYVISLLPVLNLIQAGSQGAADRYTYMPLLAPMLLASLAAALAYEHAGSIKTRPKLWRAALTVLCACIVGLMVYSTHRQIPYWKDSVTLWTRERAVFPYEPLAYNQLANAYLENKDYKKAEFYITIALQLNPRSAKYYLIRSRIYMERNFYTMALEDIEMALSIDSSLKDAYLYRQIVRSRLSAQ